MGDDTEWMKLSTEQKVQHTSWKARQTGYDELKKLFEQQTDEKSPEYTKYGSMLKKAVADSNAVAQDRALIVVETYLRTASVQIIGRFAPEFCSPLVQKCIGAARNSTKEKAFELLLTVIELEKGEAVFEAIFEALQTKQPKLLVGCLQLLRLAVQQFGVPVCPAKSMVKEAMRLIEDRDKAVREECKALLTDIARYVGALALKQQLSTLNDIVQKQLEAEFATLTERAVPTRFTRSQQAARAANPAAAAISAGAVPAGGQAGSKVAELDPFSLMEAVDVLKAIPADFFDKIEAKKWQERKEALEAVDKPLHNAPKLADGDYGRLVNALCKVLQKDVNVMCAGMAAQCLTLLARGLRNKFSSWARDLITDCLFERLKERKLTTQLRDCLDAAFAATSYQLDAVGESTLKELENKNPTVKSEIAYFLARSFLKMNTTTLPKKWLKPVTVALTRTAGDGDPQVREASFEALGAAMRCVGERNIAPFLSELDEARTKKIRECFEKLAPESAAASASASAAKPGAPAKPEPPSVSEQPKGTGPGLLSTLKPVGAAAGSKRPSTAPASTGANAPAAKTGAASKAGPKAAPPKKGDADLLHNESDLSESEVDAACSQLFGAEIVTQLIDADRKTRLAATESVQAKLKQLLVTAGDDPSRVPTQAIVRLLARKPGLRDSNIQILKIKLDCLRSLLDSEASRLSQSTTSIFLIDAAMLLGDTKHAETVRAILVATAEHCSIELVAREVLAFAFPSDTAGATKEKEGGSKAPVASPKVQEALLLLVASALRDFGMQVPLKILIDTLRAAIASSNAAVRAAAFTLTGVVGAFVGAPRVRANFEADQKPAVLAQLDAEFEKQKDAASVAPTRMLRGKKRLAMQDGAAGVAKSDGDSKDAQPAASASAPVHEEEDPYTMDEPVDVLKAIPADVFDKVEAKKWQERKEALECVEKLLHNASRLADGEYASLVAMLSKCAQKDVNVMCAGLALQCLTLLARGLRTKFSQYARDLFGETLIDRFKERKLTGHLRDLFDAAIASLNYSLEPVGEELLARLEAAKSPTAKQELALFLARIFVNSRFVVTRCLPKGGFLKTLVTPLLRFANDGDPQVREAAFEVLGAALRGVGERPLTPLLADLDEQKMKRVREHFEKLGGVKQPQAQTQAQAAAQALPAKPQATVAPAAAPPSPPQPQPQPTTTKLDSVEIPTDVKRPQTAPAKKETAKKEPAGTKPAVESEESASKKTDDGVLFDAAYAAKDQRMREEFGSAASRKAGTNTQLSCVTKGVRWDLVSNMQHVSREHQDALRTQLEAHANRDLIESLLNFSDFKVQLKALDALLRYLGDATVGNFVANLDLVFKILTLLNFENNNSTLLLKSLELLQALLGRLVAMQPRYALTDYEALLLVPLLLVKLHDSSNNQTAKDKLKSLVLRELTLLCPAARVFTFALDSIGKKELKNAKFRIDCVELLHALVELFGFNVCATACGGPGTLKQICSLLAEQRDTAMRVALVQLLVLVNAQVGDAEFARHVAPLLAEKDAQMLEDRKARARRPGAAAQLSQLAQSASNVHGSVSVPAQLAQPVAAAPVQQLPIAASAHHVSSHQTPGATQSNTAPVGDDNTGRFHFSAEWDVKPLECELPGLPQIDLAPIFAPFEMPRIVSTRIGAFGERMSAAQLSTLLAELGSSRFEESVGALVRLKDVLDDAPIADRVLADDSEALNRIVMCIAQQLGTLLVRYVDSVQSHSTDPAETRLVKLLLGTVTNLIDYPKVQPAQNTSTSTNGTHHYTLVTQLNADVLHKLCLALCIMLADDRVHAQFEKSTSSSSQTDLENAGRSAQAILGRLVEHAACTAMLTALCHLVADSARSLMHNGNGPTSTERFFDVVTRCTTRFLRRLNAINEKLRERDDLCLEEVYIDLDRFLRECPTSAWKSKAALSGTQSNSNKPFRLLRTIVYQLVTLKGFDSLRVAQLTLQKDSELLGILNKSVKKAAKTNQVVTEVAGVTTASLREQLAQIFVRIGARELAQDGLVELFHFRKRHPQIDVNAFLEKAGENFQKFVSVSLRNIELEEELRRSRDTIRELNRRAAPGAPNELLAATELDSPMEPIPEEIFTQPDAIRPFFAKRFESFGLRFAVDANANFNFETTLSAPHGTLQKEVPANDTALNLMDLSVAPHLDTTLQRADVERPSEQVAERPAVQQADLAAIQRRLAELRSGKK